MLKWFKTITKKLFNEADDNNEEIEMVHSTTDELQDEEFYERPAFRFPIITDAEIYGWDEDEQKSDSVEKYIEKTSFDEQEDDYEPIPLYKNDRWPDEHLPGTIYKANGNHFPKDVEIEEPKEFLSQKASMGYRREPKFDKVVKRSPGNRFVPTEVPSPIHGYSKPEKWTQPLVEREPMDPNLADSTTVDHKVGNIQLADLPNLSDVQEDVEFVKEASEEPVDTGSEVYSDENIEDSLPSEESLDERLKEPFTEVLIPEERQTEVVVDNVLEDLFTEESFEEQHVVRDLAEPIENENLTELANEKPTKKERIVPFNVLMLKSDKAKTQQGKPRVDTLEQTKIEQRNVHNTRPVVAAPVMGNTNVDVEVDEKLEHYVLPSLDYLIPPETQIEDTEWLEMQSDKLEESLSHFGVTATVTEAVQGPTVTRFEFTVGQGTKVSRVRNLTDDLKLTLAARDIRIQAPIPGKSSIGIEIPNRQTRPVRISEVIQTDAFIKSSSPLEAVLGLGLTGEPVTIDLRKMPHGMIAGATGSGKSVCINSILVSLLYKASPTDLKMMLIDPKMVELAPFNGIPHLISPVITDVKAATAALKWAVNEMERRYELLAHAGVRDIERYNQAAIENRQYSLKMPYLLIVIDELADLMMVAPADVEVSISRIAQKARACGIHLIIATQRPSVDVITGTIKANIPTRIAFSVSSQVDSRTIIDTNGAERLLGKGDMLYIGNGQSTSDRLQGTFVTDDEIERIIKHVQSEASPTYLFGQDELLKSAVEEEDSLFAEACLFIYQQDSASTSMLQRNFSIGYNRAAKLMDRMEKHGFISAQQGSKARDVYLTESDLDKLSEPVL